MNHTESGCVAVGAPNSMARIAAETAHRALTDKSISALAGFKMVLAAETGCMLVRTATIWPNQADAIRDYVNDMVKNIYHGTFDVNDVLRRACQRIGLTPTKKRIAMFVRLAIEQEN